LCLSQEGRVCFSVRKEGRKGGWKGLCLSKEGRKEGRVCVSVRKEGSVCFSISKEGRQEGRKSLSQSGRKEEKKEEFVSQ